MRKIYGLFVVAVLALAAAPSAALATHSNGEGPDKDFVNGSAKQFGVFISPFGVFDSQSHINAQANAPLGGDAQGHFFTNLVASSPNLFPAGTEETLSGDVRCLDAVGSTAVDRGIITESTGPVILVGASTIGKRIDGGEPGAGNDQSGGNLGPPIGPNPPPGSCNALSGVPVAPIDQGNFTVHDGI
jgi:hypothetical protein